MERLTIDEVIAHCERNVKMKEKYAGREFFEVTDVDSNFVKEYWEHRQVAEWLEQLKAYRDAEEHGLLYMKVYVLEDFCHKPRDCEGDCDFCGNNELCVDCEYIPYSKFDNTKHFKTREEAEQALKQMGE